MSLFSTHASLILPPHNLVKPTSISEQCIWHSFNDLPVYWFSFLQYTWWFIAYLQYFDQLIQPLNNCHYLLVENNNHHIYYLPHVLFLWYIFFMISQVFMAFYFIIIIITIITPLYVLLDFKVVWYTFSQDMSIFNFLGLRLSSDS